MIFEEIRSGNMSGNKDTEMISYREEIETIATIEKLARTWDETRTQVLQRIVRIGLENSRNIGLLKRSIIIRKGIEKDIDEIYNSCVFLGEIDAISTKIDAILYILGQKTALNLSKSERDIIESEVISKIKLIKMIDLAYYEKIKPILRRHKKIKAIARILSDSKELQV